MRVAIVYNEPGSAAPDQDVLVQRDAVTRALSANGHTCTPLSCTLDLSTLMTQLEQGQFDCVFNLVESLGGTDRLAVLVPLLLDARRIAYTGNDGRATMDASDKVLVKARLSERGLPTPAWLAAGSGNAVDAKGTFIIKARFEHASVGMDDAAVVTVNGLESLRREMRVRSEAHGTEMFAEEFIAGREFNISVMADASGACRTLPAAEIDFSAFPEGKPRIVGFDAKWTESSFEYNATPRRFCFPSEDNALVTTLNRLSEIVWDEFGLKGYARVDYRVDQNGQPFILEINTNPCLSPDAGFAAAVAFGGGTFDQTIVDILEAAVRRR